MAARTQYGKLVAMGKRSREEWLEYKRANERALEIDDKADAALQAELMKASGMRVQMCAEVAEEVFEVEYKAFMKAVHDGPKPKTAACEV